MSGEFIPGITSGNTREHKIRTFLSKPPQRAKRLVHTASTDEGSPLTLGEWQREEVLPTLSTLIIEQLEEYATEMGGAVTSMLTYLDSDARPCTSLVLKRQANHIASGADLALESVQGDARSLVVQAQAQSLLVQRLYLGSMQGVLAASQAIAARANDQAEDYRRRIHELEHERDELITALRTAEEMMVAAAACGEGEEPPPLTPAQAEVVSFLKQVAPLIVQRLLTQGGPAQAAGAAA